jgi:Xaa-Pro aminopeptidase
MTRSPELAAIGDEALLEQMGSGILPQLPAEIYEDRFSRCRALMRERGLAVLIVYSGAMPFQACEWARYFANYVHPYWNGEAFIVIPHEGEPALLINYGFMLDVARETGPIKDVRSPVERFGAASRYAGLKEALQQILEERGYTRTHPLIGHGIGTFVNEPPFVMPWNDFVIEKDMVINLEPAIYDPEVGGVRIEDPYLITHSGAERLTTISQECYIA